MTTSPPSPLRARLNEALAWSPLALLVLVVITGVVSVGNLVASERSFNMGANHMAVAIDRSLTSVGLEGVTGLVSPSVKGCVVLQRGGGESYVGWFKFDQQEALGASAYKKCYVQQLSAARLLSNPENIDLALLAIEGK